MKIREQLHLEAKREQDEANLYDMAAANVHLEATEAEKNNTVLMSTRI